MKKFFRFISRHKISAFLFFVVIGVAGYFGYNAIKGKTDNTRYVLAAVEKGTIITTTSGSGQVSALDQLDVKSNASGDLIYLGVKKGQDVKSGTLIARIDNTSALKAVRDAEANLQSTQLSLEKLKQPADALSILQAENALIQANEAKQSAEDNLNTAYDDGFDSISSAFLDLPTVMSGLNDILLGTSLGGSSQWNIDFFANSVQVYDDRGMKYRDDTYNAYKIARAAYDKNFDDYKAANRLSDKSTIEALMNETYDTSIKMSDLVKSANNLIQFYEDRLSEHNLRPNPLADTYLSSIGTYTSKTNSHLSDLRSAIDNLQSNRDNILSSERTIAERTQSLANLKAGADAIDLQSQELQVAQRENALADAKSQLTDYDIKAPFNGTIAAVNISNGDTISSGTSIVTLITKQQMAEISLNEVDVANVKLGQKATLTFDAFPDLSMSGEVSDIDTIGTSSQGVVSYNVKITFDTQDDRIKPGMSVSVDIITEVKQDVLMVPNAAIKIQGNSSYVQIPQGTDINVQLAANLSGIVLPKPPISEQVGMGISNDQNTEIVSGLKEGDLVVVSTITSQTTSSASGSTGTQQRSSNTTTNIRIPGLGGGGGGFIRN